MALKALDTPPLDNGCLCTDVPTGTAEQAELYRMAFAACPVGFIVWNKDARIVDWNPASERIFGWTRAEAIAQPSPHFLVPSEVWPHVEAVFRQLLEAEAPTDSLNDNSRRDGQLIHCEWHNIPMRDPQNRVTGFVSIVEDVTNRIRADAALQNEIAERCRAEGELERVLTQNAQVLASISSILIGVDADGLITTWNGAASTAFGLRTSEALGQRFADCGIRWNWDSILAAVKVCETDQTPVRLEDMTFLPPDGKERFLGVTLNPISHYSDEPQGFLLLAADITQRRILEGQLATAQKLESIGQLAAGIAHEINTPIQYVGDNLRFLQDGFEARQGVMLAYQDALRQMDPAVQAAIRQAEEDADAQYLAKEIPDAIRQAVEGIERVSHIVRAMKEFSHPGTTHKVAADLNRALDSTLTVAHNEWKYVADLVTDYDLSLPLVPCLPAELNQVFLNMIVNAAHAIGDVVGDGSQGKGTLTVRTRHHADQVEISIGDTGTGMPEEVRARIFDPFFTTKPVGRGTGQGLAISHTVVVEKHGGSIAVETAPGQGTRFVIHLPITEAAS